MSKYLAPSTNYWSTTLNGAIDDDDTTITLNSTSNLQAPGFLVIDREDGNGTATSSAREVISFTGISGSNITGVTRADDGSTARSHSDGALVESIMTVGVWNDLQSNLITASASIAVLEFAQARGSFASINTINSQNIYASAASVGALDVSSLTGVNSLSLNNLAVISAASVQTMFITTHINASGASTEGFSSTINNSIFRAHRNGTALASGIGTSATKVVFTTESFDTNSDFASSTFTPTIEGYYQFNAKVHSSGGPADQKLLIAEIYKNGSSVARNDIPNSGAQGFGVTVSDIQHANGSSDYFDVYTSTDNATPVTLAGEAQLTYFSGERIPN